MSETMTAKALPEKRRLARNKEWIDFTPVATPEETK